MDRFLYSLAFDDSGSVVKPICLVCQGPHYTPRCVNCTAIFEFISYEQVGGNYVTEFACKCLSPQPPIHDNVVKLYDPEIRDITYKIDGNHVIKTSTKYLMCLAPANYMNWSAMDYRIRDERDKSKLYPFYIDAPSTAYDYFNKTVKRYREDHEKPINDAKTVQTLSEVSLILSVLAPKPRRPREAAQIAELLIAEPVENSSK